MTEQDGVGISGEIAHFKIEKFAENGELFEVIEGSEYKPSKVTFRKEGLAPEKSYARNLECDFSPQT